jgi:hypothetical protein
MRTCTQAYACTLPARGEMRGNGTHLLTRFEKLFDDYIGVVEPCCKNSAEGAVTELVADDQVGGIDPCDREGTGTGGARMHTGELPTGTLESEAFQCLIMTSTAHRGS